MHVHVYIYMYMVELQPRMQKVVGSSPTRGSNYLVVALGFVSFSSVEYLSCIHVYLHAQQYPTPANTKEGSESIILRILSMNFSEPWRR